MAKMQIRDCIVLTIIEGLDLLIITILLTIINKIAPITYKESSVKTLCHETQEDSKGRGED